MALNPNPAGAAIRGHRWLLTRPGLRHAALAIPVLLLLLLALPGAVPATNAPPREESPGLLGSTPRQKQVARMTTRFVERFHYNRQAIDDRLSEQVLANYLEALDGNRQYFLEPDITYFNRYRQVLDDVLLSGDVEPVFDIFRLYRLRAQQNLSYALSQLEAEPDFAVDEDFRFDREEAPWITTPAAMQDNWRKRVKNDAVGLLMADKTWPQAAEILTKRYERMLKRINQLDSDEVFETFMNAFARTLDPHSSYLSPRQSEEYRIQMSLSYQGIGASLQLDDEVVKVLNVIPGGPAAIDGRLKANDRIVAVGQGTEGEMVDVVGWQLDDVVQLIRGPGGTTVRLQVQSGDGASGPDVVLSLVRDKVKLEEQAAKSEVQEINRDGRNARIGIITVPSFYQDYDSRNKGDADYVSTTRDVRRLLGELEKQEIEGLVIDLRGNGGGHLSEATALTGLFIDSGPIVQLRDTSGRIEVLPDPEPSVAYDGPLVVLVDRFSASASEIFTAAIQDYRRGIVIGQQTFGKGTVQNLYPLDQYARRVQEPGLGQLTLTIGKYYRVTGGSTQNKGVVPDIALPTGVDPGEIGENSRDGALPWDQIEATRYRATHDSLDSSIAYLTQHENERMQEDPDVHYLKAGIEAAEELRNRTTVSLDLAKRRAERESQRTAQLERENQRRQAVGLPVVKTLDEIKPEEQPDVLLKQAAQVLGDYIMLERSEKSAANRPGAPQPN